MEYSHNFLSVLRPPAFLRLFCAKKAYFCVHINALYNYESLEKKYAVFFNCIVRPYTSSASTAPLHN